MFTDNDNAIRIMVTLVSDGNDLDNNKQGNETSIEKLYNVMNDNDIDYEDRQIYCVSDSDDADTTNNDNSNHNNTKYNGDDNQNYYQRDGITLLIF